jgi:hypothetical protein
MPILKKKSPAEMRGFFIFQNFLFDELWRLLPREDYLFLFRKEI